VLEHICERDAPSTSDAQKEPTIFQKTSLAVHNSILSESAGIRDQVAAIVDDFK
jgi:hypothetical protein